MHEKPTVLPQSSPTVRFWVLDILRGVAILAVICFHILPLQQTPPDSSYIWVSGFRYGGTFGVTVFFVLSGFSIHLSQLRKHEPANHCRPDWKDFFVRRLRRLYPAYLGAICLAMALNSAWALIRGRDLLSHLPSIADVLSHLLLAHTLNPETFMGIIPALWFVGVLAHMYLLYPFFYWLVRRWGISRATWVVLCVTMGTRFLAQYLGSLSMQGLAFQDVLWMNAPQRWFEWCFGAWIAHRVSNNRLPDPAMLWVSLLLSIVWLVIGKSVRVVYEPVLGLLVGCSIWSMIANQTHSKPAKMWHPLLLLGKISYPIYLLHQIFVPYVNSAFDQMNVNAVTLFILTSAIVLLVTLPVSVLFDKFLT